ncbi:hypothetical protein ACIQW7_00625 [Peribacillus simplex]|uniref:hypothetical protein n=1 Tax=Peribacillus TaxID=2675229 RepID=UPI00315B2602
MNELGFQANSAQLLPHLIGLMLLKVLLDHCLCLNGNFVSKHEKQQGHHGHGQG